MKRPSFQFYPADWRNNAKLRRCSEAARGAWIDVLCLMHDADEYGVLRWPLAEIARAAGLPLKLLKELAGREVIKGGDEGCAAYSHTPMHARKKGDPVTLLERTSSPCWYSSRLLVDEWRRSVSGGSTRFKSTDDAPRGGMVNGGAREKASPRHAPGNSPGARRGAGATSTSTSSSNEVIGGGSNSAGNAAPCELQSLTPGEVCKALAQMGVDGVNPGHAKLLVLLKAGAAMEEFLGAARDALARNNPSFSYIVATVEGRRRDAKAAASGIAHGPIKPNAKPWYITASGIEAQAAGLGIEKGRDESFPDFKNRVLKAAGITPEMIRAANLDYGVTA